MSVSWDNPPPLRSAIRKFFGVCQKTGVFGLKTLFLALLALGGQNFHICLVRADGADHWRWQLAALSSAERVLLFTEYSSLCR